MKTALMVFLLTLPTLALGQSLGEVAKRERERREKNKREGKTAIVISEEELSPDDTGDEAEGSGDEGAATSRTTSRPRPSRPAPPSRAGEDYESEEDGEDGENAAPTHIPPDVPLEERIELFERMKRDYQRQAAEIDRSIAENEEQIRQLEARLGSTSALGGGGLPVAPQTGTGAATQQMTGQDDRRLAGEIEQLQKRNEGLRRQKESLKATLQEKGRRAGIPPGYLRF